MDLHRQIHEAQDTLVGEREPWHVAQLDQPLRPVHLVSDHEDLAVEAEICPALRRQRCVLSHSSGSPSPISAKVISRTRSRISDSWINMLRFPWAGRILMSAVYSMQESGPLPG